MTITSKLSSSVKRLTFGQVELKDAREVSPYQFWMIFDAEDARTIEEVCLKIGYAISEQSPVAVLI